MDLFLIEDYLTECSFSFSQLNRLVDISVRGCAVSHAGPTEEISRTCTSILFSLYCVTPQIKYIF